MPYTTEDFATAKAEGRKPWEIDKETWETWHQEQRVRGPHEPPMEAPDLLELATVADLGRMIALNIVPGDLVLVPADQGINAHEIRRRLHRYGIDVKVMVYLALEQPPAYGFIVPPGRQLDACCILGRYGIAAS